MPDTQRLIDYSDEYTQESMELRGAPGYTHTWGDIPLTEQEYNAVQKHRKHNDCKKQVST